MSEKPMTTGEPEDWGQELTTHMGGNRLHLPPGRITLGVYEESLRLSIAICLVRNRTGREALTGHNHRTQGELQHLRQAIRDGGGNAHDLTISHTGISMRDIAIQALTTMAPVAALGAVITAMGQHPALALGATICAGTIWATFRTEQRIRQIRLAQTELIRRYRSFRPSQEPPTTASTHPAAGNERLSMLIQITPEPTDQTPRDPGKQQPESTNRKRRWR